MTLKPKTTLLKLPLFFTFLIAALIIYSCRKDNNNSQAQSNSQIDEARAWYENTFPVTNKISGGLQTQGAGKNHDLTQWIKPDWQHPNAYIRNGESVIEMPIDPASKFASSVKLNTKRFNPKYSRSYYLVIHDSTKYNAYILTIVADSSYVGNDLSKLGHNTYRKHDPDFTGSVLYFTPKGDYLGGYGYNNGKLMEPGTPEVKAGSQQINSVHTDDLKDNYMKQECTDWYIVYYKDGEYWYDEYLTTTCTMVDDGSGQGGGGGPPPPPPPCPTGSHPGPPVIRPCIPPAVESIDNGNNVAVNYVPPPPPPGDDGLPPPPSQSCSVDPPREPCPPALIVNMDSLKKKFPCAVTLVIDKLSEISSYNDFVMPFASNKKPDLNWNSGQLSWNSPDPLIPGSTNTYKLGETKTSGRSADVTLNSSMLQKSSQLLIAATVIHESIHAYVNYNIVTYTDGFQTPANYNSEKPWLYALDVWAIESGIPPNYRDHNEMLTDYFNQAVSALKAWDNGAHTDKEYAMSMLYGLDTGDFAVMQSSLAQTYSSVLTKNKITTSDLQSFWAAQLNATSNTLPTNGCN